MKPTVQGSGGSRAAAESGAQAAGPAPESGPELAPRPTGRDRLVRLLWVGAFVALDLWSKSAVFAWLTPAPGGPPPAGSEIWRNGHLRYTLVDPYLGFMLGENHGAAWGVGADYPYLLVGGRIAAVGLIFYLLWMASARPRAAVWALVLVLAGALGNLHDNLMLRDGTHPIGAVRDFIDVYFPKWNYHFPTFNAADSCITVGAVFLIFSALFPGRATRRAGDGAGESTG